MKRMVKVIFWDKAGDVAQDRFVDGFVYCLMQGRKVGRWSISGGLTVTCGCITAFFDCSFQGGQFFILRVCVIGLKMKVSSFSVMSL